MNIKFIHRILISLGLTYLLLSSIDVLAQDSLFLEINGDALTVDIDNVALEQVVETLNQQTTATLEIDGSVLGQPTATVSAVFENVPLRDGVNRLLKGHNHLINYRQAAQAPGSISIRLVAASKPLERPLESPQEDTPLETANSDELIKRMRASLEQKDTDGLTAALAEAVEHPAVLVRREAIRIFRNMDDNVPIELLHDMVLTDPDSSMRLLALEAAAKHRGEDNLEETLEVLAQAEKDADSRVSDRAAELFEQLSPPK